MAKKSTTKKPGAYRDSAIIINGEQFCLVSSQTVLSSNNRIETDQCLSDSEMGSLRRAGFFMSLGKNIVIDRNANFDGISLIARENNVTYNYKFTDTEEYELSGMVHPSPSVANFTGGYSSRDGCFLVNCNTSSKRILYVSGTLDRGKTRLTVFGFPTTVAKALHNTCTAFPELIPDVNLNVHNDYDEIETFPIYGQVNTTTTTYLRLSVQPDIFGDMNIQEGDMVAIRVELPKVPNGTCIMRCIAKT